jgi:hypothetical protein
VRRLAVNHWIRNSGAFDTIIDFDRVVANPNNSAAIATPYDSGDHLIPTTPAIVPWARRSTSSCFSEWRKLSSGAAGCYHAPTLEETAR